MQLTTLVELLEREIGASPSARSTLAQMVAERGQKDAAARAGATANESRPEPGRRKRAGKRAG